jgi:uncharacterized membrane-anchored protein
VIIVLQLTFLGYQTFQNEQLLSNGTLVKLELQPLDPRSMLQGDYVQLNYSISQPTLSDEEWDREGHVQVVLKPDEHGVYAFDRFAEVEATLTDKEVVINGTMSGYHQIHYGIESYFVPEGTGEEVEQNARYAYVRVGSGGNALIERLVGE